MKKGFTLAEFLITLGIIGVVAAMTMPTLIAKYKEHVLVNQVKTGHSILHNSVKLYVAKNECVNSLCLFDLNKSRQQIAQDFASTYNGAKVCKPTESKGVCEQYSIKDNNKSLAYKQGGKYTANTVMSSPERIILPNGTFYRFHIYNACPGGKYTRPVLDENGHAIEGEFTEHYSDNCGYIYMDVNGLKRPNQFGADIYRYDIKEDGAIVPNNPNLLNNVLIHNKVEYEPYNFGDDVE